jgi:RNA polymerase sigma factor (sigma-70 family)
MLNGFGRHSIPNKTEQLERGKAVRRWLDWPDGPDQAPKSVQRAGKRAQERLVVGNMRMVVTVAKKYTGMGHPLEDLIQEGAIGLQRAVHGFDPGRGYTFGTYAYWWVRQAMTRSLQETGDTIRIPTNVLDILFKVQRHVASSPNPVTDAELMQVAGLETVEQLNRVRSGARAKNCGSTSILLPDEKQSLEAILACPKSCSDIEEERLEFSMQLDKLSLMLPHLSEGETEVIEMIYLNEMPKTEIARMLDTTTERVASIERKALNKLRRLALMDDGEQVIQESLF